ncbi:MAG: hypothetical protein ABIK96_08310 [bacterium]|nr:hypothetical protein [bacterium]
MSGEHDIRLRMPSGLNPTAEDLEVLRTTFQTIITLASESKGALNEDLACLRDRGWEVTWGLTWVARASKDKHFEEVTASTKEEALAQLRQHVGLHEVEGCP